MHINTISYKMNTEEYHEVNSDELQDLIQLEEMKTYDYVPPNILKAIISPIMKVNIKTSNKTCKRNKITNSVNSTSNLLVKNQYICKETGQIFMTESTERSMNGRGEYNSLRTDENKKDNKIYMNVRPSITLPYSETRNRRRDVMPSLKLLDIHLQDAGIDDNHLDPNCSKGISHIEHLIDLVKEEGIIYDTAFQQVIRQVSAESRERGMLLSELRRRYAQLLARIPQQVRALQEEVLAHRKVAQYLHSSDDSLGKILEVLNQAITENEEARDWIKMLQTEQRDVANKLASDVTMADSFRQFFMLQRSSFEKQIQMLTQKCNLWQNTTLEMTPKFYNKQIIVILHEWEMYARYILTMIQQQLKAKSVKDIQTIEEDIRIDTNVHNLYDNIECEMCKLCVDLTSLVCALILHDNTIKNIHIEVELDKDFISKIQKLTTCLISYSKDSVNKIEPEQKHFKNSELLDYCNQLEKSCLKLIKSLETIKYSDWIHDTRKEQFLSHLRTDQDIVLLDQTPADCTEQDQFTSHCNPPATVEFTGADCALHRWSTNVGMVLSMHKMGRMSTVENNYNDSQYNPKEGKLPSSELTNEMASESSLYEALDMALRQLRDAEMRADKAEHKVLQLELKVKLLE